MAKSGKIYERVDDLVYERNVGSVARTLTAESKRKESETLARVKEDKLWGEMRRAAKTNNTLQEALDHAIMIYKLSKEYKDGL
jgi:hypothetical protein